MRARAVAGGALGGCVASVTDQAGSLSGDTASLVAVSGGAAGVLVASLLAKSQRVSALALVAVAAGAVNALGALGAVGDDAGGRGDRVAASSSSSHGAGLCVTHPNGAVSGLVGGSHAHQGHQDDEEESSGLTHSRKINEGGGV